MAQCAHKLHLQLATLQLKNGIFRKKINILTIHNDQISYVKHVSDPLYVFFTLFWCLEAGRLPRGLGHNLLMQFSTLYHSTMEISETYCFDLPTIHNDQIPYVNHVLHPLYMFVTYLGV